MFARRGYHATSTREIARIADLSENTLFRYFNHKEDIFWAALRCRLGALKLRREVLEGIAGSERPEVVLPLILEQLVDIATVSPEIPRLIGVAFLELPSRVRHLCHEHLGPVLSAVKDYLNANMRKGTVRNLDAGMVLSALAAMVILHSEVGELIDGETSVYSDKRQSLHAYAKFWLNVLILDGPELPAVQDWRKGRVE